MHIAIPIWICRECIHYDPMTPCTYPNGICFGRALPEPQLKRGLVIHT